MLKVGDRVRMTAYAMKQFPFYAGRVGTVVPIEPKEQGAWSSSQCVKVRWDYVKTIMLWHRSFIEPIRPVGPIQWEGDGSGMEEMTIISATGDPAP